MVPADRHPSYEELAAENAELRANLRTLREEASTLRTRLDTVAREFADDDTLTSGAAPCHYRPAAHPASCGGERPGGRRAGERARVRSWTLPMCRRSGTAWTRTGDAR